MPLRGFPSDTVNAHKVARRKSFPLCKRMCRNGLWSILECSPTGPEHQRAPAVPKKGRTQEDDSFLLFIW